MPYTKEQLVRASWVISKMAIEEGIPEKMVRDELKEVMKCYQCSQDPAVQKEYQTFHFAGQEPTVEEFLLWITKKIHDLKEEGYDFSILEAPNSRFTS